MKPEWNGKQFLLLLAALVVTALLAVTQSILSRGLDWSLSEVYWPAFLSLLIPVLSAFALIAFTNRLLLPGERGSVASKFAWLALALRLSFLIIVPVAMLLWGYPSDRDLGGSVELDAADATHTAWLRSTESTPLLSNWQKGDGDNTGGLTVIGVAMFRLFSPDMERSLLLGVLAAALTSLTVVVTFRLADILFDRKVARWAALLVAIYPEAILIGTGHQQQGYLALLLGVEFLAIAALMAGRPPAEISFPRPGKKTAWFLLAGSLALLVFISKPFVLLACLCGLFLAVWLSDPRRKIGKLFWGGAAAVVVVLIVLRLLDALDIVSGKMDPLLLGHQYLFGYAWSEFDKLVAAGSGDMFQKIYMTMERPVAFVVAAFYGLLQPVLPAAIGYRNEAGGGAFWICLGIFRGLGWYMILPIAFYGTLKSLGGLFRRKIETSMAIIFWIVAFVGSYRALGDNWDNPRYRLFALIPLALLAAWGWVQARETSDPWLARIILPFAVAVIGLTVWYLIRDAVPMLPSLAVIAGLTTVVFVLSLLYTRRKNPSPTG